MKLFNEITVFALLLAALLGFSSCEQKIQVESVVHEDGSIDRTIVLYDADSGKILKNMFGASRNAGWDVTVQKVRALRKDQVDSTTVRNVSFHKRFISADEANLQMNSPSDTLFRIRCELVQRFRWLYTDLNFSDTYVCANRFHALSPDEYFTDEDYAFIGRLPAENKSISQADSLYLAHLKNKISDQFATRAIFEEYILIITEVLKKNNVDAKWQDTLALKKKMIFERMMNNKDQSLSGDQDFLVVLNSFLRDPLPLSKSDANYVLQSAELKRRIDFMTDANEASLTHIIEMPWKIIENNADSVHGTKLYWQPRAVKFLLKDYTMFAGARKINYWTLVFTGIVILLIIYFLFRKSSTS